MLHTYRRSIRLPGHGCPSLRVSGCYAAEGETSAIGGDQEFLPNAGPSHRRLNILSADARVVLKHLQVGLDEGKGVLQMALLIGV